MDTNTKELPYEVRLANIPLARELSEKYDLKDVKQALEDNEKNKVKISDLERKVTGLEEQIKRKEADSMGTFEVLELAVKNDPEVKALRDALAKKKSQVLHRLCMDDDTYLMAFTNYRTAVERAYKNRDKTEDVK